MTTPRAAGSWIFAFAVCAVMSRAWANPEPNLGVAGNIVFCAMRDIAAGEELTVDYAMFDRLRPPMPCRCGTPSCRGTVTGDDGRDPVLRARYDGWFAWHLAAGAPDRPG